uniref:Uncharacterized protein n=1 Tax=Triticum urartu TaxID=4572 RepID=A0A8R7UUY5_TRIUA
MVAPMVIAAAGLGMLAAWRRRTGRRATGCRRRPGGTHGPVAPRAAAPAGRSASAAVGPTATSAAGRAPAPDASGPQLRRLWHRPPAPGATHRPAEEAADRARAPRRPQLMFIGLPEGIRSAVRQNVTHQCVCNMFITVDVHVPSRRTTSYAQNVFRAPLIHRNFVGL